MEYNLCQAKSVTEIDEDQATMVTSRMNPATECDGSLLVCCGELAAGMCSVGSGMHGGRIARAKMKRKKRIKKGSWLMADG